MEVAQEPADINAPRHRMSLRAVMHFLFERAGFNRWYPAMEGKRTQAVLHKYLLEASDGIQMKGVTLSERLYVPEQFHEEQKSEIAERRRRKLAVLQSPEGDGQFKMAIALGGYKGDQASPLGRKGRGKTTIMDNMTPFPTMPSRAGADGLGSFSYYDQVYLPESVKDLVWEHGGERYRSQVVFPAEWEEEDRGVPACAAWRFMAADAIG